MQWEILVVCCHKHIFILHKFYLFYLNMSFLLNKFENAETYFSLYFVIFDSLSLSIEKTDPES